MTHFPASHVFFIAEGQPVIDFSVAILMEAWANKPGDGFFHGTYTLWLCQNSY